MMGWTCCWAKKHIDSVHLEHSLKLTESRLKENPKWLLFTQSDFHESQEALYWTLFWTFQALDVYTTYEGLKCEGVEEKNPLFPDEPKLLQIILTKAILIAPIIYLGDLHLMRDFMSATTGTAVVNNAHIIYQSCN
jgi:hypothetical protein